MQCPQCKNEVPITEAHYGALYTCPKCMAVYFVNFEGQAEYGDMEIPNFQNEIATDFSKEEPSTSFTPELVSNFEPTAFPDSFASTAQDITDYGNEEETLSSISYDVLIKGLDTKEVMQEFKDAIDDSKFGWITQDILSQIKNGESHLKSLNPIQAYVLASRIQFLNLEIEWKQNVAF